MSVSVVESTSVAGGRLGLAAAILAGLAAAVPAHADIYTVGVGLGCTHASVQAAVDAGTSTSEADLILVARNTTYSNQDIAIVDQSLTLLGGFPNCSTFIADGRTVLDGSGGAAEPVIRISGTGNVTIEQINLTGGDESETGLGGGLFFEGSGVVRLAEMNINGNQAGTGGGIFARGTSDTAALVIGENVLISNNTAARNGGGISAIRLRLTMRSPGSAVFFNTATGFTANGTFYDGDGGGIECVDCVAYIGTSSALGTLFLNTAHGRGGALAVFGSSRDASADIYSPAETQPTSMWGNKAGIRGGAIYAQSSHESIPPEFYHAHVLLWDTVVRDNAAPQGAAIHIAGDTDFTGDARAMLRIGEGGRPAGGKECAPALRPCNRISGNESRDLEGEPTGGAIVEGSGYARFELADVLFEDNVGRSVLRNPTHNASIVRGSVFTGNTVSEELVQHTGDVFLFLDHATITGNQIGGTHAILAKDVWLGHSIVWEPGKLVLRRSGSGDLQLRNLLVNDIGDLPPQVDIIPATTPGFVAAGARNFRLRASSEALDFAVYGFDPAWARPRDVDGLPREVDLPTIPNEFGPRDLGAYERQTVPSDILFADGFE